MIPGMAAKTAAQLVQDAKGDIENLTPDQVQAELATGNATLVDVRDAPERANGTIPGAIHASRGMLEFHAAQNEFVGDEKFARRARGDAQCQERGGQFTCAPNACLDDIVAKTINPANLARLDRKRRRNSELLPATIPQHEDALSA